MALSEAEVLIRKEDMRLKKWNEQHKEIEGVDHKLCNRCELYFPATFEHYYKNDKNGIDGLYPYCIRCSVKKSKKWKGDNMDKVRAGDRKRNSKNERKIYNKEKNELYRSNGGRGEWEDNNRNKLNTYSKERTKNKKHAFTTKQWIKCKEYFNDSCAYCGHHFENHFRIYAGKLQKIDLHKEHVMADGSNEIDNCVPSCAKCNTSKHDKRLEDWYNKDNDNYSIDRINKIHKWLDGDWNLSLKF